MAERSGDGVNEPEDDPIRKRALARVGQTLRNKWHLDALLGIGGMAAVYAATHRNGRRGAVKVLHTELSIDPELRNRFLREGLAANKVKHPASVEVLDDDTTDDGAVFLVMELLEGERIESRWERDGSKAPPNAVLLLVDTVLDVLAVAHAEGVIHRDIKPENVFLTNDGDVKLLDFGIARVRELSTGSIATRNGVTLGTPSFMAPEQALGRVEQVDAQTDLWSVGAMMFTLLSGELVHAGNTTVNEVLVAAATHHARSLAVADPQLPQAIVDIVDRALQFDKASRWPDAVSMQRAVREAYETLYGDRSEARRVLLEAKAIERPATKEGSVELAQTRAEPRSRPNAADCATQDTMVAPNQPKRRTRWGIVAVAAFALIALVALVLVQWRYRRSSAQVAADSASSSASASAVAQPSTSDSAPESAPSASSPPAASTDPLIAPVRQVAGTGKLSVSVKGGACQVLVDGQGRGPAPIVKMPIAAGEHQVTCIPAKGGVATRAVRIKPGETAQVYLVLPPSGKKK